LVFSTKKNLAILIGMRRRNVEAPFQANRH
jgi:hypothetical protein